MTDLERLEVQVQRQIDMQNARIDKIDVKLDAFIQEMRDRDNQRAAETAALRAEMIELAPAFRREDYDNLTITAMVGVGAAVIGIGVMVVGLWLK